jgi:hypothetical protein
MNFATQQLNSLMPSKLFREQHFARLAVTMAELGCAAV